MNDTPRTNAMLTAILETHGHVGFLNCPPAWVAFARELERELNAANQIAKKYEDRYFAANEHIKRLEDALRRIANQDYRGNRSTESQIAAEALKEAKP